MEERLDDRTLVRWDFGGVALKVIAWHEDGRPAESECEGLDDPTGLDYSRRDTDEDDPTPVSPARGELHTGAVTDEGLVEDTALHCESGGWKDDGPGGSGVKCACGVTFDGFDSLAEAGEHLARHIGAANAEATDTACEAL